MSKIFNGMYVENMSLLELQAFSVELRKKIIAKMTELAKKEILRMSIRYLDILTLENAGLIIKHGIKHEQFGKCPLMFGNFFVQGKYDDVRSARKRDENYDFGFNIIFIPIKDKILALPYYEFEAYGEVLKTIDKLHPYPFWTNTDKDPKVSDSEWDKREMDWFEGLGDGSDAPILVGLNVVCVGDYLPMFTKEDFTKIQSPITFEDRVKRLVDNQLIELYNKKVVGNADKKVLTNSEFFLFLQGYQKWKLEGGSADYSKLYAVISTLLKKEITIDDLLKDY